MLSHVVGIQSLKVTNIPPIYETLNFCFVFEAKDQKLKKKWKDKKKQREREELQYTQ